MGRFGWNLYIVHWMPLGYRAGLDLTKLEESYHKLKEYAATDLILMPSGGGVTLPQPETAEAVKEWNNKKNKNSSKAKMVIATATEFFNALELREKRRTKGKKHEFEVRKGEMYSGRLSEVFPDCTSSRMWIKQGTKEFENILLALERWNAISCLEGCMDSSSSSDLLRNYWKKILFIAMHDALPGTGIDEVYGEIKEILDSMEHGVKKSLLNSLNELSKKIEKKSDFDIINFIVFNSLPWEVSDWTEAVLEFDQSTIREIANLKLLGKNEDSNDGSKNNDDGNNDKKKNSNKLIDLEILDCSFYPDNSIKQIKIGFVATIPAFGFRTFEIVPGDSKPMQFASSHETYFRNNEFEIQVSPDNATVTVSKNGKSYLSGNELVLEEELGDLYYHRENLGLLKSETGGGVKYGSFKPENFIVTKGKLRSHIILDSKYYALRWPYRLTTKLKPLLFRHNFLDIRKEIIIYNDLPRIDFITHIYDRHPHSRIRVKFDTPISSRNYWSGTQFGAIERKVNQFYYKDDSDNSNKNNKWTEKPTGIFPSLEWTDYSDNERGVSLLHRGIPSHEIRDNSIYLTLLRSVVVLSADGIMGPCIPTPDAPETRPYTFRYSVLPHVNTWKEAATYRHGMEINMPLIAIQVKKEQKQKANKSDNINKTENNNESSLPSTYSFLQIDPKNIVSDYFKNK